MISKVQAQANVDLVDAQLILVAAQLDVAIKQNAAQVQSLNDRKVDLMAQIAKIDQAAIVQVSPPQLG